MLLSILKQHGPAYFLSKIIPGIFALISIPVFVRLYGLTNYGQIMLLFALCNFITVFSCGWLCQSLIRFQIISIGIKNIIKPIYLSISASIIFCVLTLFLSKFIFGFGDFLKLNHYIAIIFMTINMALFYVLHSSLQSLLQSKNILIISLLLSLLSFLLPILFYFRYPTIAGFIFSYAIAYGIASIVGIYFFLITKTTNNNTDARTLQLFKYGFPISIWLSLQSSIPFIERSFINLFLGPEFVGKYTAISEFLIRGFSLLIFPITMSIQPVIMKYWNDNQKTNAVKLWKQTLLLLGYIFLILASSLLFFSDFLINITLELLDLYIEQNSALVLLILFSGFFWQANLIFHKPLELEKKSHVMLLIMFFSLAIMVLINFFAIPIYGLTGAAFATACAALVYGFVNIVNGLIFFNKSTITHK